MGALQGLLGVELAEDAAVAEESLKLLAWGCFLALIEVLCSDRSGPCLSSKTVSRICRNFGFSPDPHHPVFVSVRIPSYPSLVSVRILGTMQPGGISHKSKGRIMRPGHDAARAGALPHRSPPHPDFFEGPHNGTVGPFGSLQPHVCVTYAERCFFMNV